VSAALAVSAAELSQISVTEDEVGEEVAPSAADQLDLEWTRVDYY